MRILVAYYSAGGNTADMAKAISRGASRVRGTQVTLKDVRHTSTRDLKDSDVVIVGSPTYYGVMAAPVKKFFDDSVKIHGRLSGKVGAAFTSAGGTATGAETTILSILEAMLIHGMVIQGNPNDKHYGLAVVGRPNKKDLKLCSEFGWRIAEFALRVRPRGERE